MAMEKYGTVAVLMGGWSNERDISLKSGAAVLAAMQRLHIDAIPIDVDKNILSRLQQAKVDRVFNILHGRVGEDGVIQGALELMGLPYTGSGVLASALGMDKQRTKEVWLANGLPTPGYLMLESEASFALVATDIGFPCVVKPVNEGSSIGITKVESEKELKKAYISAKNLDKQVMVEQWVLGKEYTVSVLGKTALPLIRLETPRQFYDYAAKYSDDSTQYFCPCGLDNETERHFQTLALQAFEAIGARDWGRVDIMVDENVQPWLIELNTLPGMTNHSLVPMAAKAAGMSFDELVLAILDLSMHTEGGYH